MHHTLITLISLAAALLAGTAAAGPRDDLLAGYAAAARTASPAFAGFSAARGKDLHTRAFAAGKADTPACTSCHGQDPRGPGRTLTGKPIEAMALSVTPARYGDPAKVEKWFKRNCNEVLGRACSAQEKGDWLTYMAGQ